MDIFHNEIKNLIAETTKLNTFINLMRDNLPYFYKIINYIHILMATTPVPNDSLLNFNNV